MTLKRSLHERQRLSLHAPALYWKSSKISIVIIDETDKVKTVIASQDPVDSSPAVLVRRFNMTRQKELELQLSVQQEVLQR